MFSIPEFKLRRPEKNLHRVDPHVPQARRDPVATAPYFTDVGAGETGVWGAMEQ